ncbi:MAG TPA: efflux RND transporter periplasmic adaptor subunit [Acidobacteriaceae bacterium]|nr:efflux RND transporter periplasmic adaptor subunit [Acidobacteriaceae bacterium]
MRDKIVFLAAALTLAALAGCSQEKHDYAAEAPPPAQVESSGSAELVAVDHPGQYPLFAAAKTSAASTLNVTGTVAPDVSRTIPVISIANGRVVAIHAQIGDTVRKGQLLMEVQSSDIAAAFDQYLKAVNDERLAHTQDDRAKLLFDKGAIAKSQLEIADDGEQNAQTSLSTAEEQLRVLGIDKDHPSAVAKVYSPASGVIIAQNVTDAAATGIGLAGTATAFTIADLSQVWILCDVYENDLPTVHVGQQADIRLNAYPDRVLHGTISEIDAVLDPSIRTAKVRIQVSNPGGIMRVGMFATATFHGKKLETVTSVPATAVLHLHDRDWVFVPAPGGKFRRQGVVGGAMLAGGMQEISSGLEPGDQVVTNALELQNTADQQ